MIKILRLPAILFSLSCLLLTGCQESGSPGSPAASPSAAASGPVLANVPSLSELAGSPAAPLPPLPTLAPEAIALGQTIYQTHCASCHGADLEGQPDWQSQNEDGTFRAPPHDADGHTWHHSDAVLIESIQLGGARLPEEIGGTSPMPAFAEVLSDQEIAAVLAYIKSQWPADLRAIQWQQTHQAAQ